MNRLVCLLGSLWFALNVASAASGQSPPASRPATVAGSMPAAGPVVGMAGDQPAGAPASLQREPISVRRIVKHFDFDEKPLENYTNLPMLWRPHRAELFPLHNEGRFDEQIGRAGQPSFRMEINGGSVAYRYEGNDIAVRTNSDYLVVAWARAGDLGSARAYVTACFLDRKGLPIAGTDRRSELVSGTGDKWTPLRISMSGNVPGARYIGLTLWLSQQPIWDHSPKPPRFIDHEQIRGGAWFDDVTVYRLPRVLLRSSRPSNVFAADEPVVILPEVSDPDGLHLRAVLDVQGADGQIVEQRQVTVGAAAGEGLRFTALPPGLYQVTLRVSTQDTPLVWRNLRLVQLSKPLNPVQSRGRGLGIVLGELAGESLAGQRELLSFLRPSYVKLPVWYAQRAMAGQASIEDEVLDGYLAAVAEAGGIPVGVQMDDPRVRRPGGPATIGSMLDLLDKPPVAWKPGIAGLWTRYAGLIHIWQLGADLDDEFALDQRWAQMVPAVRREMQSLMPEPWLATPVSVRYTGEPEPPGDFRSIHVPAIIPVRDLAAHAGPLVGRRLELACISLEPVHGYDRKQELSLTARRTVEALYTGAGAAFVPGPWDVHDGQIDPTESFLVLHTIADLLGGARPVCRMSLAGRADAIVFDRNGQAVVFVFDEYAAAEGDEHTLYLGENARHVDLWGRELPMVRAGSQHRLKLGPMPTFIVNTPTWLLELRRSFVVEPVLLQADRARAAATIGFRNTFNEPISGTIKLIGPEGWEVRPTRVSFTLQAGEAFHQAIEIRFPANAESGVKVLLGEFSIDARRRYTVNVPAWFELGLKDIEMETFAFREAGRGVVRVSMTNRTGSTVNFDGDLIIPDRERVTRLFSGVQSGQSMTKEFIIDAADQLVGRRVRVHFNERQGPRVWNRILSVP